MAMPVSGYYTPVTPAPRVTPPPAMAPAAASGGADPDLWMNVTAAVTPLTAGIAPGLRAARGVRAARGLGAAARGSSARALRLRADAAAAGRGLIAGSIWTAIKTSLLFKGVSSLALNAWKISQGKETLADGGANVVGDFVSAGVGGTAAGLASGLGTSLLAGILGTGWTLTIAGSLLGAAAFFVTDSLLRDTTFYNNLKATVHDAIQGAAG